MELSVYTERLNNFLELQHEEGLIRYIVVEQKDFVKEVIMYEPFTSLQVHIDSYIQHKTQEGSKVGVDLLADISVLKVVYSESNKIPAEDTYELSTGFYGLLNKYSLIELIFNEVAADEEAYKEWLNSLFIRVDGLEAEYNEYKFFLKNLHNA